MEKRETFRGDDAYFSQGKEHFGTRHHTTPPHAAALSVWMMVVPVWTRLFGLKNPGVAEDWQEPPFSEPWAIIDPVLGLGNSMQLA